MRWRNEYCLRASRATIRDTADAYRAQVAQAAHARQTYTGNGIPVDITLPAISKRH